MCDMEAAIIAIILTVIAEVEPPLLFLQEHGLASVASLPEAALLWHEAMSSPPAAPGADLRPQSACAKLLSSTATTPQPRNDNEAQTTEDFDDDVNNNNNSNGNGNDVGVGSSSSSTTNSTSSSSSSLRASSVSLSSSGDGNGNPVTWRGRPSWLAEAGRPPAEELRARRKTDPCDYRAELLWQPYDCRSRSSSPEGVGGGGAAPHHRHLQPPPSLLQCAGDSGRAGTMAASVRTFTSTEAQTDDLPPPVPVTTIATPAPTVTREQRRRERRQRRRPQGLPDILHSHLPPPYSTLPLPVAAPVPVPVVTAAVPPPPPPQVPPPVTTTTSTGIRFPFQISPAGRRRSRRHYTGEEEPKSCCGVVVTQTVSIRWFIVMIAFVGVCCAVVGTVLGAMKASGREHLTVSLLMIGVGVVLVTVSAVAWRLTAHDAPSCRSMLGLGGGEGGAAEPNRRFVPRLPPSYGRPHHPYAAMMYPEFQYRAPPPSYQASMQEYRLRLLLLDRAPPHAVSPPPTYRSNSGSSTLRAPLSRDQHHPSRPPSYRSRATVGDAPATDDSESTVTGAADGSAKLRLVVEKDHNNHHNLVTIVQTDDSPVIVTVSGSTPIVGGGRGGDAPSEMEILAHL